MHIEFTNEQKEEWENQIRQITPEIRNVLGKFIELHLGIPISAKGMDTMKPIVQWYYQNFGGIMIDGVELVDEKTDNKVYLMIEHGKELKDYFPEEMDMSTPTLKRQRYQ